MTRKGKTKQRPAPKPVATTSAGPKVSLGARGHEEVQAILQHRERPALGSSTAVDLGSRRFASRLSGLYDKLVELGFKQDAVEKGLTACCMRGDANSGVTLDKVLDWLCLHLSPDELPRQFTDGESREANAKQGKLDIGHAGGGLSMKLQKSEARKSRESAVARDVSRGKPLDDLGNDESSQGLFIESRRQECVPEDTCEVDKSWILGYVQHQTQLEAEETEAAQAHEDAMLRWETMMPEEKLQALEVSFEEEKAKAKERKASGRAGRREKADMEARLTDIREQISELRILVGHRKRDRKRAQEQLPNGSRTSTGLNQPEIDRTQAERRPRLVNGTAGPDEESFREEGLVPDKELVCQTPKVDGSTGAQDRQNVHRLRESATEHSVIQGLFGESESEEEGEEDLGHILSQESVEWEGIENVSQRRPVEETRDSPEVAIRPPSPDRILPRDPERCDSKADAESALKRSSKTFKQARSSQSQHPSTDRPLHVSAEYSPPPPVPRRQPGVPRNWSGKVPRQLLGETLQKHKLGRAIYAHCMDGRDVNGCVLTFKAPSDHAEACALLSAQRFESIGEFESYADAQHAVATRALFHITPDLQLSRVLPPPFRDYWQAWQQEARARKAHEVSIVKQGKREKVERLMQSMKELEIRDVGKSRQGQEARQRQSERLPGMSAIGWEEQVVAEPDAREGGERMIKAQEQEEISRPLQEEIAWGEEMRRNFVAKREKASYKKFAELRANLPVAIKRQDILDCVRTQQVVVISGETGCGKSTQVGQYLLEDALLAGQAHIVNLVCCQPRRVAAVSLAERVAQEMGDSRAGEQGSLVGYQIRMESRTTPATRLTFCTTGILMRRLQSDPQLKAYTHIILDEVHERQALGDFCLVVLRDLLYRRLDLRIILMSATIQSEMFTAYFDNCPSFTIPGRTFPVVEHHLEDVLDATRHYIEEDSPYARKDSRVQYNATTVELTGRGGNTYSQRVEWAEEDDEAVVRRGPAWARWLESLREERYDAMTMKSLRRVREDVVNFDLLEDLIGWIVQSEEGQVGQQAECWRRWGAILVFLPGLGEIRATLERLRGSRLFRDEEACWILPLHSALTSAEQQRVFRRPPSGTRKIILSTNIAETSVTIDDVAYVIDTGLVREVQLANRGRGGRALVLTWCSRASVKQRMGRAGRVGPGLCFRLFSSYTHMNVMQPFAIPELQRIALEELCLQIRSTGLAASAREFLMKAPEPPTSLAIDAAIRVLHEVGALVRPGHIDEEQATASTVEEGELTPLGVHLAKLPLDVRLGKMLIFATLLHCLDPVLTIAAALSASRLPFLTPIGKEAEAKAAHAKFEYRQSDFLTLCAVFQAYRSAIKTGRNRDVASRFCSQSFLGRSTMQEIEDLKCQYLSLLIDMDLLPRPRDLATQGAGQLSYQLIEEYLEGTGRQARGTNTQAGNTSLVIAVVTAGLYPHVVHAAESGNSSNKHPVLQGPPPAKGSTASSQVYLPTSSVNHHLGHFTSPWLTYHEKFTTARTYISPTSVISPYALLLFGGPLIVKHLENKVIIDDWIHLQCAARTALLFREARQELNEVLEKMIRRPLAIQDGGKGGLEERQQAVVDTVIGLFRNDPVRVAWISGSLEDPAMQER